MLSTILSAVAEERVEVDEFVAEGGGEETEGGGTEVGRGAEVTQ